MTKTPSWDALGFGSWRWTWNIVPKGNYFKYVNEASEEYVDITSVDVQGNLSQFFFTENTTYSRLDQWVSIDVSDYGIVQFKGGDEDYWNGKGFTLIFPLNETYIDPTTVMTGDESDATRIEQQRKVWKNPRGLGYYYALSQNDSDGTEDIFEFFTSSDGSSWENVTFLDDPTDTAGVSFFEMLGGQGGPDTWIEEDDANSRTLVYVVSTGRQQSDGTKSYSQSLWITAYAINDTLHDFDWLWNGSIAGPTDDDIHNANIVVDEDGYLWASWTDEFTNKGKQRNQLRVTRTTTTYPTSAPSWETIVNIYGEDGSSEHSDGLRCNSGPYIRSELVPVTATHNVSVVFSYFDVTPDPDTYAILGIGLTAPGGSITEDTTVTIDSIVGDLLHSSVAESGVNSDVFVAYQDTLSTGISLHKWDISADSSASYGIVEDQDVWQTTLSLSIDKNADPDMLYCFWANSTTGDFYYDSTEVDAFSLEGKQKVDDDSEAIDHMTSSYEDWTGDGELQLIYTTQTNNYVRFHSIGGVVGNSYSGLANVTLSLLSWGGNRTWSMLRVFSNPLSTTINSERVWSLLRVFDTSLTSSINLERTWSLTREFTTALTTSINTERLWSLLRETATSLSFSSESYRLPWSLLRVSDTTLTLTTTSERVWSLLRTFSRSFSLAVESYSWYTQGAQIYARIVDVAMSLSIGDERVWSLIREFSTNLVTTINTERSWILSRVFDTALSLSMDSERDWSLLREFSTALSLTVNSQREWTLFRVIDTTLSLIMETYASLSTGELFTRIVAVTLSLTTSTERIITILREIITNISFTSTVYGVSFIEYLFNLYVSDSAVALSNVAVSVLQGSSSIWAGFTFDNGSIPELTIQAGNYTVYMELDGFVPYENLLNLAQNISWDVAMTAITFNMVFFGFIVLACASMYLGWKQEKPVDSIYAYFFSLLLWLATGYQWVIDNGAENAPMLWVVFVFPILILLLFLYEEFTKYYDESTRTSYKDDPFTFED
jgi:hypothetical protein